MKIEINPATSGQKWVISFFLVATFFMPLLPVMAFAKPAKGIFSLVFENDIFSNTDQYYTNGIRLSWLSPPDRTPDWALHTARMFPLSLKGATVRTSYAIGQDIYTPKNIGMQNPPSDDRPYAGWLYGALGLTAETGPRLDQLELTVGVIGPDSFAKQTQDVMHNLVHTNKAHGWGTQLNNEPGVILTYRRCWRGLVSESIFGVPFDLTPHAGGALGNVFTYADAGFMLRYGKNLPFDYGPPGTQPNVPGSGFFIPQNDFSWYLFAGFDGRAVARNIFLDGNTFRDSRSVAKNPLVGDLQFGIAIIWGRLRLGYTHVLRTREFKTQVGRVEGFGVLSLSVQD